MTQETQAQPSGNSTLAVVTAIYLVVLAIINLCASLAALGLGAIGGSFLGAVGDAGGSLSEDGTEVVNAVSQATGLLTIWGIIGLVVAVAALVVAVGLFMKKPWAYMGTLGVNAAYIILTVLTAITGGGFGILQIVFIVISGIVIYLFYTDKTTKAIFGQA